MLKLFKFYTLIKCRVFFSYVNYIGINQIPRKHSLCGRIRAKEETFSRCKEAGTEGSSRVSASPLQLRSPAGDRREGGFQP